MSTVPSSTENVPTISGRIVVIGFIIFIAIGVTATVLLARHMRPVTMAAKEKAMPLAGTVKVSCEEPGQPAADVRQRGTCSQTGQLVFSIPEHGTGIKTMSYVVLGGEGTPPTGQFPPTGEARVDLHGASAGTRVATFIYADGPVSLPELTQAIQAAPPNIPAQLRAVELYVGKVMHADGQHLRELRTARVELKITG